MPLPEMPTAKDVVDLASDVVAEGADVIINKYKELIEVSGQTAKTVVEPLRTIKDFKDKGGLESVLETDLKLSGLAKALGLIPIVGKQASENMKDLAEGLRKLSNTTEQESKIFDSLSDIMTLKAGTAYKKLSEIMMGAATQRQAYQIELTKLGQGFGADLDKVMKNIDAQANALAMLGISNKSLQEAVKDTILLYNASVQTSDKQTKSFEMNRVAIQDLMAFNKKFGIEHKESGQLVNLFNTAMQGGTKEAIIFSEELQKFADKTGQPTNQVFKSFTENMDRFAVMSMPRALESFGKLEAFAKRSGKELKTIITDMEKYDDLSGGYEKLGKMNRILMQFGSSIDPMTFMKASDEERQKMLIEAVSKTQGSFATLQTDQARRQVAKALADATDLPFQTALGLATGKTGLKEALDDALKVKTPSEQEMTGYTPKERLEKAKAVTSFKEAGEIRDGILQTKQSVDFLAKGTREADFKKISQMGAMYEKLDKDLFMKVAQRDVGFFEDFSKKNADILSNAIKDSFSDPANAMTNFVDAIGRTYRITPDNKPATPPAGTNPATGN